MTQHYGRNARTEPAVGITAEEIAADVEWLRTAQPWADEAEDILFDLAADAEVAAERAREDA